MNKSQQQTQPIANTNPGPRSSVLGAVFDRMHWESDRMLLGDLVFRVVYNESQGWDGPEHFMFYKARDLVNQYQHFFTQMPGFAPEHIFELGIYDGGSTAFWYEIFQPKRLIAIDIRDRVDSPYFRNFIQSRGLGGRVQAYWNTNQADAPRLRELAAAAFDNSIDLVLDDCSHLYAPTRVSFECLFPLLRPGGLYIIEDWAWAYIPDFNRPESPFALEHSLSKLVNEIVELAGHPDTLELVEQLTIFPGFVVVERGSGLIRDPLAFRLPTQRAPNIRWAANLRLKNAPTLAALVLQRFAQVLMPPDSGRRRVYRAARRRLEALGILRRRNPKP